MEEPEIVDVGVVSWSWRTGVVESRSDVSDSGSGVRVEELKLGRKQRKNVVVELKRLSRD